MSAKRPPLELRPRPLTRDEAAVAADLLRQPVTPSWLGQRSPAGKALVLRPPRLDKGARRRGGMANLDRWDIFAAEGLDDAALFAATLRTSRRWAQRQR